MQTVLIVIHLMIVLALVGVVLLQRSEGGGLGIGGGSGFMTARGAANALTRATAILAAAFFATSLILSISARYGGKPTDFLDRAPITQQTGGKGVLDQLPGNTTPAAPAGNTAPTPPSGDAAKPQSTQPANGAAAPAANGATAPATQQPAQPQVPNQ
ncbi:MAG TPA: preprotein translocase subunit SecG [Mesorhizobium sp.]|jgi:preprotein translocase subunit SecG|uniref:preprotein translocase subunit SecG n=1 Tax=Mesorhizobium sp. TaxID=1871066 RepID=UPI002DDD952C|nr:preprotein translocase subunit SecG [Mesorhizobium sp.]HEV2504077.1 preprotein translocase subunit SecG [Mesorhizobium sp.]